MRTELKSKWPYLFIVLFNLIALAILYHQSPRYFLQDDNWAQFGPYLIAGPQALFEHFQFPIWNPWTSIGVPCLEIGTYALYYPVTYLSYAIAHWIIGQNIYTVDVFCVLHIVAGTFICYRLFLKYSKDALTALYGSLAFCYSGFFLVAGKGWFYVTPLAFYLPLLFGYVFVNPLTEMSNKRKWGLAFWVSMFFLSGNVQMWAYAIVFWALCFLAYSIGFNKLSFRRIVIQFLLPLGGRVFLFVGPQLLLTLNYLRDVDRYAYGNGFIVGWRNFFVPSFIRNSPFPAEMVGAKHSGSLYFGGGVFVVLALVGLFDLFIRRNHLLKPSAQFSKGDRFLIPLLGFVWLFVCLWGSWSGRGSFWQALSHIPPFGSFTAPHKLIPFVTFFAFLFAALRFQKFLSRDFPGKKLAFGCCIAILLAHIHYSESSFYSYGNTTYPSEADVARYNKTERVINDPADRSRDDEYPLALPHNLGLITKNLVLFGYEPFVSDNLHHPYYFWNMAGRDDIRIAYAGAYGGRVITTTVNGKLKTEKAKDFSPLAFCETSRQPLVVHWDWNQLALENPALCKNEPIILGWTYWKYFQVPAPYEMSNTDKFKRLKIVPNGQGTATEGTMVIRYSPPLLRNIFISIVLFLLCELLTWYGTGSLARRYSSR